MSDDDPWGRWCDKLIDDLEELVMAGWLAIIVIAAVELYTIVIW